MNLLLYGNDIDTDFLSYLLKMMKYWFTSNVNYDKMSLYQNYINLVVQNTVEISIEDVCEQAINSLEVIPYQQFFIVQINSNIKVKNCDLRVIDVVRLINNGVLGIQSYPIFSDMFNYFGDNIEDMYQIYQTGVVR